MSIQDSQLAFTQNKKYNRKLFESQNAQKPVLDHIFLFNVSKIMRANDHARHNALIMSMI